MVVSAELQAHLASGATHLCRCWSLVRRDGVILGFTDHDVDLDFDSIQFVADSGMTAYAHEQTTGLAVDNSEAMGVLSHHAITEDDIQAGRYDGAAVRTWLVNWSDVSQRLVLFAGTIGEIRQTGGAFQAELRGLTEALNQPQGRVFQKSCAAVLGDRDCQFDMDLSGFTTSVAVETIRDGKFLEFTTLGGFADRWFERGRFTVENGAAAGMVGIVKNDRLGATMRQVELWEAMRAEISPGDMVRLEAGCNKRHDTCRLKFNNLINFRGFPMLPGEDWLVSVPRRGGANNGKSLRS